MTRHLHPGLLAGMCLFASLLGLTSVLGAMGSGAASYPCPKGCECASLDDRSYDKVQVHCNVLNIEQDLLNFTVIQTERTALLYLICSNIFDSTLYDSMFSHLTQLEYLYFSECSINRLFAGAFDGLEALNFLYLTISEEAVPHLMVEPQTFNNTPYVGHIYISRMGISELPVGLFCGLQSLNHLNLSENLLKDEQHLGLIGTTQDGYCTPALSELDLRGNALNRLSEPLHQHMPNLEVIYLQDNRLQHIGERTFANLSKLALIDLSNNQLTVLDERLLTGLNNLLILWLNNNQFTCLPQNLFEHSPSFYLIDLSDNRLTEYCLPSLRHLKWLQLLRIGDNKLSRIDNATFSGLYQLTELNLEGNVITAIDRCAFCDHYIIQEVKLNSNSLSLFNQNNIFGYDTTQQLKIIDLSNNRLNSEGLVLNFTGLHSLTQLHLGQNNLIEIPTGLPKLRNLTWLDLQDNVIEDITHSSFEGFPNVEYLILSENRIGYIPKKVFRLMPHLIVINLSRNKIHTLEYECFDELPKLKVINLKYNKIRDINVVFYNLPTLEVLLLDYNEITQVTTLDMPKTILTVTLSHNSISKITGGYFLRSMPYLKLLDLTYNKLTTILQTALQSFGNPTVYLAGNHLFCSCRMLYLQTINESPTMYARIGDLPNLLCYTLLPGQLFKFLLDLHPDDFLCEYSEDCPHDCGCCYKSEVCPCFMRCPLPCQCLYNLDKLYNRIECSERNITEIPADIPNNASHIYIDGNSIPVIDKSISASNNRTIYLFLNHSSLEHLEPGVFSGFQQLRVIHLDNNSLKRLQNGTFHGLANLEELYLQNNAITDIQPGAFDGLDNLKILHLEHNFLESVEIPAIDTIASSLTEIYLSGNNWTCDCVSGPPFQDWLISVYQKIKDDPSCVEMESGLTSNSSKNLITEVNFEACFKNTREVYIDRHSKALIPVTTAMLAIFIFILISTLMLYRYRDIIQVWLYSRYGVRLSKVKEDEEKDYDAFISYSSKDETFVVRELAPRLEEGDPPFQVCVHYRDWIIGRGIAEAIISSVHSSRRTIMLLSNSYIQSEWCNYEFQTAHHQVMKDKTCRLIVILMEDEPPENLDDELKLYIKTHTYIRRSDPWFWERLKYALPSVPEDQKTARWEAKVKEKEIIERTKQALREFNIEGPQTCSQEKQLHSKV